MQAFIDFFTGALNDFAWLYMFLPCVMVGGILLTVRTKAVQFSHFGYAMKNTVGKMFKKTEAGKGAVTPLQAVKMCIRDSHSSALPSALHPEISALIFNARLY